METTRSPHDTRGGADGLPRVQRIVSVLWPSFLVAGVATVLTFAFVDPRVLAQCQGWSGLSRMDAYGLGFFGYWLLTAASSGLTCYFRKPIERIRG